MFKTQRTSVHQFKNKAKCVICFSDGVRMKVLVYFDYDLVGGRLIWVLAHWASDNDE